MYLQDIYEIIEKYKASIPVDVTRLARELGIVVTEKKMDDDVSGHITKLIDDKYQIEVNSTHHHNRKKFTVAHEIGHYLYDSDVLENNQICDEKLFRSSGCSNVDQDRETRANRFAASLLMPTEQVVEHSKENHTAAGLAMKFDVSLAAMRLRLQSLGIDST